MHSKSTMLGAVLLVMSFAPAAGAQTPAAQPTASVAGAADELGGPLVANVCLLSREEVFSQSKVGQSAIIQLKQLGQKAQANFDADRRKLEAEAKALQTQAQAQGMTPAQAQHRQQQLQARAQALQGGAAQTTRDLEATRARAMGAIEDAVRPIVADAYKAKGCGLLLSRDAVIGGNLANDLTAQVTQALDAKMSTISLEREHASSAAASR